MGLALAPLLILTLAIAVIAGAVTLLRSRAAITGDHAAVTAVFRRLTAWRIGGFALAVAGAIAIPVTTNQILHNDGMDAILVWVPATFALIYLLAVLFGERTAYRPAAATRTAALTPREPRRYLPTRTVIVAAI